MAITYIKLKEISENISPHLNWDDITVGEMYMIPKLGVRGHRLLLVCDKNEYMIKCKGVNDEGELDAYFTNIFKSDSEMKFLVKLHTF